MNIFRVEDKEKLFDFFSFRANEKNYRGGKP